MDDLLRALVAYQRENRLTDFEMAAELGIHRSTWSRIQRGRRRIGHVVLQRILRRFPELGVVFLMGMTQRPNSTNSRKAELESVHAPR